MHQHTGLTLVAFYVCVRLKHASARQTRHRVHATWRCIHPGTSAAFLALKAIVGFMNNFPLVSMQRMQRYNVFVGPCLYLCSFLSLFFYAFNICSHAYFAAHRLLSWMPGAGGGSASCGWIGSLSRTDKATIIRTGLVMQPASICSSCRRHRSTCEYPSSGKVRVRMSVCVLPDGCLCKPVACSSSSSCVP